VRLYQKFPHQIKWPTHALKKRGAALKELRLLHSPWLRQLLGELTNGLVRAERALRIELGTPRFTLLHELNALKARGIEREKLLHADTIAVARHREVASDILLTVVDCEDLALEILNAELVAFLNLDRNANDITRTELGVTLTRETRRLLGIDLINKLDTHGLSLLLLFDLLGRSRVVRLEIGVLCAANQGRDSRRGLRTILEPLINLREVDLEVVFLDLGIVPTQDLKELAVTGRTLVRRDNTISRMVRATRATHSKFDHLYLLLQVNEIGA